MPNSHTFSAFSAVAIVFAGGSGVIAVAMGAVASHALTDALAISRVDKASAFQFYHTFALIFAVVLDTLRQCRIWRMAAMMFMLGIVAFSGSIYLAAFGVLGSATAVAPLGGFAWMLGWLLLATGGVIVRRSK